MSRPGLILFVVASLCLPVALPAPAHALSIDISIGTNLSGGRSISCAEGARRVRNRGFRDVRSVDCRGRYFVYRGWRDGRQFEIAVRRSNGRVADVRRVGRRGRGFGMIDLPHLAAA
jgi:hypothetical protein